MQGIKHSFFLSCLLIFVAEAVAEVQNDRLWLPESHAKYFLDLKKAAEAADNLERCVTVLRATLDLEKSTSDHPVFIVLCRQVNGRSYNEIVDGLTFETTTIENVIPVEPTAEDLEAIRLEEERQLQAQAEQRRINLWNSCETTLHSKVALMNGVTWLYSAPPEPEVFDDGSVLFIVDFDAQDAHGAQLRYRARCEFSQDDELEASISARKDLP